MPDATQAASNEPPPAEAPATAPAEAPATAPAEAASETASETAPPGTSRDPAARIQRLTTELRAAEAVITVLKGRDLEATAADLSAQLKEASAAADLSTADRAEAEAAWSKERASWGDEKALLAVGLVGAEGQAVARALYQLGPAEDRPPLSDWLANVRGAPPPALAPYLRGSEATPAEAVAPRPPPPGDPAVHPGPATRAQIEKVERELFASPAGPRQRKLHARLAELNARR